MSDRAVSAFLLATMVLHGLGLSVTIWFRRQDRNRCATSCPCGGAS